MKQNPIKQTDSFSFAEKHLQHQFRPKEDESKMLGSKFMFIKEPQGNPSPKNRSNNVNKSLLNSHRSKTNNNNSLICESNRIYVPYQEIKPFIFRNRQKDKEIQGQMKFHSYSIIDQNFDDIQLSKQKYSFGNESYLNTAQTPRKVKIQTLRDLVGKIRIKPHKPLMSMQQQQMKQDISLSNLSFSQLQNEQSQDSINKTETCKLNNNQNKCNRVIMLTEESDISKKIKDLSHNYTNNQNKQLENNPLNNNDPQNNLRLQELIEKQNLINNIENQDPLYLIKNTGVNNLEKKNFFLDLNYKRIDQGGRQYNKTSKMSDNNYKQNLLKLNPILHQTRRTHFKAVTQVALKQSSIEFDFSKELDSDLKTQEQSIQNDAKDILKECNIFKQKNKQNTSIDYSNRSNMRYNSLHTHSNSKKCIQSIK